jgi:hypothetical protein
LGQLFLKKTLCFLIFIIGTSISAQDNLIFQSLGSVSIKSSQLIYENEEAEIRIWQSINNPRKIIFQIFASEKLSDEEMRLKVLDRVWTLTRDFEGDFDFNLDQVLSKKEIIPTGTNQRVVEITYLIGILFDNGLVYPSTVKDVKRYLNKVIIPRINRDWYEKICKKYLGK